MDPMGCPTSDLILKFAKTFPRFIIVILESLSLNLIKSGSCWNQVKDPLEPYTAIFSPFFTPKYAFENQYEIFIYHALPISTLSNKFNLFDST